MSGFDGLGPLLDSDGPFQSVVYVGPGSGGDPANPLGLMDLVDPSPLRQPTECPGRACLLYGVEHQHVGIPQPGPSEFEGWKAVPCPERCELGGQAHGHLQRPTDGGAGPGEAEAVVAGEPDDVLCHLYKVLCNDVPNCGCNEPQAAYELVYRLLVLAPFHQGTWREAQELIGSSGAFQIVIAALTEAGLLEHGGTLGGSWLTGKGRWVLWAVEQVGGIADLDDRLSMAGFPHYDVPRDDPAYGAECSAACWAVPEGWEPAGPAPERGQR